MSRTSMREGFIRATHPYAYRSGEWAQIIGVDEAQHGRPCFLVVFPDGATDSWACVDADAGYEFCRGPVMLVRGVKLRKIGPLYGWRFGPWPTIPGSEWRWLFDVGRYRIGRLR